MKAATLLMTLFCLHVYTTIAKVTNIPATDVNVIIQTHHVHEHDNLLLVCNTTVIPDIEEFYWIRNETSGHQSALYRTGWKLEFINILRKDAAVYICHGVEIRTQENITLAAFKADVQYPTEIDQMTLSPQVITENDTFSVSCHVHGNPQPTWSIFNQKTGLAVMTATASADVDLSGVYVQCGDSGRYVCSGANRLNHGVNVTRGYNLTVQCPPRLDPCYNPPCNVYTVKIGRNVTMLVNITADPMPSYKWSRDDNKPMGDVIIEKHPRGTSLTILDVDIEHFGNYTLKMANPFGSMDVHMILKTEGSPEKPFGLRISNISFDTAELTWTSGYDMSTHQRFYVVKEIGKEFIQISDIIDEPYLHGGIGVNWTYHVTGLESDVVYKLAIVAENSNSMSFSDPIVFTTQARTDPKHHDGETSYILIISGTAVLCCVGIALVIFTVYRKQRWFNKGDKKGLISKTSAEYGGTTLIKDDLKTLNSDKLIMKA